MKIHLTVQQFSVLLFGLTLAALTSYLVQIFFSDDAKTNSHIPLTSELIEARRQNGLFDRDAIFAYSHPNSSIARKVDKLPFSTNPIFVIFAKSLLNRQQKQTYDRRTLVQNWRSIAMTVALLPIAFYQHIISNHRLGGWKETNIQFRAISQHA